MSRRDTFCSQPNRDLPPNPPSAGGRQTNPEETRDADKDNVVSSPLESSRVPMVPRPALLLGEKAPVIARIFLLHENPHLFLAWPHFQVLLPNQRDKVRASAVHDGHVWEHPVVVVCLQTVDQQLEIWPLLPRPHHVVGQADVDLGSGHPHRIC